MLMLTTLQFTEYYQTCAEWIKTLLCRQDLYNGFDFLPYRQKIPDGEIDVHAIAIATTNLPPDLNHHWSVESSKSGKDNTMEGTALSKETLSNLQVVQQRVLDML